MTILYTASFYDPHNWQGIPFRVSRYHPRGRKALWQVLPSFYPSVSLLRAYRSGEIDFEAVATAYIEGLDTQYSQDAELASWIAASPELGDFTLLCYEREGHLCHRRILAHWLKERQPALQLASPLR